MEVPSPDIGFKFDLDLKFYNEIDEDEDQAMRERSLMRKQRWAKRKEQHSKIEEYIESNDVLNLVVKEIWNEYIQSIAQKELIKGETIENVD